MVETRFCRNRQEAVAASLPREEEGYQRGSYAAGVLIGTRRLGFGMTPPHRLPGIYDGDIRARGESGD